MTFGIEKCTTYKVTCGDIDLTHITFENYGGELYTVYNNGEEFDVFNYSGDKPFDAIHDYLIKYANETWF